jgi:hypothetical protein
MLIPPQMPRAGLQLWKRKIVDCCEIAVRLLSGPEAPVGVSGPARVRGRGSLLSGWS